MFHNFHTLASPSVAPNNFKAIFTTQTNITFSWDALSRQEANGLVRWFVITCNSTIRDSTVSCLMVSYVYSTVVI